MNRSWAWYAIEAARLALAVAFCAAVFAVADGRVFHSIIGG